MLRKPASPPERWRITALALCSAIVLSLALPSGTAIATSGQERSLHGMVNQARSQNGLDSLSLSDKLSRRAHRHSEEMADSGTLFHSCLSCNGRRGPSAIGENVGVGPNLQDIHDALMDSQSHRDNILSTAYDRVGIGIVRRGDRLWVTELFEG